MNDAPNWICLLPIFAVMTIGKDRRGHALGIGGVVGAGIACVVTLNFYTMGPRTSIPVAIVVWIGVLALGWFSGMGLWSVGIRLFGLKAVTFVSCILLLATLGVLGWLAGWIAGDRNVAAGTAGAVCLVTANLALFYARRDYPFGDEISQKERSEVVPQTEPNVNPF